MWKFMSKIFLWVLGILFIIFSQLVLPGSFSAEERVNITTFGATGNGENDETEFIQKAIDFQSAKGGGTVYFPKGTYKIDAAKSITLKDNITLEFEDGVTLTAIPNKLEVFQIMKIHDVKNVEVIGKVKIIGERQDHMGTTGEWGMGVSIRGSTDIKIENLIISDNWGDGIYIGTTPLQNYSENVKIINPVINNNRRQGISVISAKNLEIVNAIISNTNGTPPQAGIDIEPNLSTDILEEIKILNLSTDNNKGFGLSIYTTNLKDSPIPVSIHVNSTKNIKDGYSVKEIDNLKGTINIGGYYYLSDKEILSKPTANILTSTSNTLSGIAPIGTTINVKAGKKIIGTSKVNTNGKYTVSILKQKVGTTLSLTVTDIAGNISKETIVKVLAEKFFDLKATHWFYKEVLYLEEKKIIKGFPNGSFQPNKNTTRAEAAKMLTTALNISSPSKKTEYSDVKDSHWAKTDIAAVTAVGLFDGYPDGSFRTDKNITRAEMAKVLASAYNFKSSNNKGFKDVANTHWASLPILGLSQNKIANGFPDGTFRPNSATTRAEFSVFLARALNKDFR